MAVCDAETHADRARRKDASGGGCSLLFPRAPQPGALSVGREALPPRQTTKCYSLCRRLIFPGLWMFIGLVSAFDTYLTVKFQECLMFHEVNPLAVMLLRLDGWDPSLLIALKFLGSVVALGFLVALHLYDRRLGLMVTSGLASFQLWLLGYLVFA